MKLQRIAIPALALGGAAMLLVPGREAAGWSTIGGSLTAESQRDFRVFNNFVDSAANDNTIPHAQFPGFDGAEMANWKAGVEWGSGPHGDGTGDPLQPNVGDGGANFDFVWAGNATSIGSSDANILSGVSSCGGGGTLAYTETPISNGWRIRYCEEWIWHDGPGDNPGSGSNFDMQGVGCHELGHALGLGHSGSPGATMAAGTSQSGSSNARSISSDDQAGVQAVYGVKSGSKPVITGFTVAGNTVTINGSNFSPSGGQVWFTNATPTSSGTNPLVRLTNVSSSGGGTVINVTIPAGAGMGDIVVKQSGTGFSTLSNAFPFDGVGGGGGPDPIMITSIVPSTVENLIPGEAQTVTINGANFTPGAAVEVDGSPIAGDFTVVSDVEITFEWEPVSSLGAHTISVDDGSTSDSAPITVVANASPTLQVGNGEDPNVVSGSAPILVGAAPGTLIHVMVSDSNVPSVLPGKINLGIGNVFQQLYDVATLVVGASGTASTSSPLFGISGVFLHWQGLRLVFPLSSNFPLDSTNMQTTFTP